MPDTTKCLVTGQYSVTVFDLNAPQKEQEFPADVAFVQGDLTKPAQVTSALKGQHVVFHVATAAPTSENARSRSLMQSVNVDGTQNVIDACVEHGVPKLVYCSSASVAFNGRNVVDKTEAELGYCTPPLDHYTGTKAAAEKLVLAANGRGGTLATCALRPSAIFGEGDALLVPALVAKAKEGKIKYMMGNGENYHDFTYVGNVVQAHLMAAEKLSLDSPIAGEAFFITNQEPRKFWQFVGDITSGLGYDRPRIKIPYLLLLIGIFIFQFLIRPVLQLFKPVPLETSVGRLRLLTAHRIFNSDKAVTLLGYRPQVSMDEALQKTVEHYKYLRNKG